jgi:uncharacterized repeat protein (TIGR03806 family)
MHKQPAPGIAALCALALWAAACGGTGASSGPVPPGGDGSYLTALYPTLEQYGMVSIQGGQVVAAAGVTAYELNTPLFTDYAVKYRTVWMPKGASAQYDATNSLDFPAGTIVTKSFGLRDDLRKAAPSVKWIETRVFVRQAAGWKGVSYAWNDAQTSAQINAGGGAIDASWIDETGATVTDTYVVPNGNQCITCHSKHVTGADVPALIGPKIRNLNRDHAYASGTENQLAHWVSAGLLAGAPADLSTAPKLPVWDDTASGTTERRARAYLDVNCAHCHSEAGFARTTGLFLDWAQTSASALGLCKPPVAVGEGSGGFFYDVVPGDPSHSIMAFRLASTTPAEMMPQLGRGVVDKAGLQLVRDWISGLPGGCN